MDATNIKAQNQPDQDKNVPLANVAAEGPIVDGQDAKVDDNMAVVAHKDEIGGSYPVFKQRRDTILLGLTGRTGSGCSYIASLLGKPITGLQSDYSKIEDGIRTNEWRQKRVINDFINDNWTPFITVKASDFIFYFMLMMTYDEFIEVMFLQSVKSRNAEDDERIKGDIQRGYEVIKEEFNRLKAKVDLCESYFNGTNKEQIENLPKEWLEELDLSELTKFRATLKEKLSAKYYDLIMSNLQRFGNNIRKYGSIKEERQTGYDGMSGLSEKIDQFVSEYIHNHKGIPKRIVIDALRSPADILYFREKYAFFYLISVSADEDVRMVNLFKANITKDEKEKIDQGEDKPDGGVYDEYVNIHISRCIEMSDIHLVNYGDKDEAHKKIVGQLFRYISLILHPGLVTPTRYERVMQVALTAKLNSGCLSRQVGAAVTNDKFSVMSIGWNEVPEKQVPCSLRYMSDLFETNDCKSFSTYEKSEEFRGLIQPVYKQLTEINPNGLKGMHLTYCFKDIYTSGKKKQTYNQVHTRSLHAEENAFLQLAKFGNGHPLVGGKLFTTASCCVLCAKKAYQLGIDEIYYIDAYPDISQNHILESGNANIRMILFQGAIGRAYLKLYDQFVPLKDELELQYDVKMKSLVPKLWKNAVEPKKKA